MLSIASIIASIAIVASVAAEPYTQSHALANVYRSAVAYCDKQQIISWNCEACEQVPIEKDTIHFMYHLSTGSQAYVAKLNTGEALVSFRGSSDIQNWIDNIKYDKTYPFKSTCPKCGVHLGFWEAYTAIKDDILQALNGLGVQKSDPIVVTGHSLGAAEAALCIFDLATTEGYTNIQPTYTFGEPRVGDDTFYAAYKDSGVQTYRVVHWKDVVPHVPPMAMGFHHIDTEVWYNNEASSSYRVCDGSGEDTRCSDSLLLPDSVNDHLHYLNVSISKSC